MNMHNPDEMKHFLQLIIYLLFLRKDLHKSKISKAIEATMAHEIKGWLIICVEQPVYEAAIFDSS